MTLTRRGDWPGELTGKTIGPMSLLTLYPCLPRQTQRSEVQVGDLDEVVRSAAVISPIFASIVGDDTTALCQFTRLLVIVIKRLFRSFP
jgi:hypothetical protein